MFTSRDILFGVVIPAAIALVAALLAWLPRWYRGDDDDEEQIPRPPRGAADPLLDYAAAPGRPSRAAWAGAVGLGVAFAFAFYFINGAVPRFPPVETTERLFYIALALALFGVGEAFMPPSKRARALPVLIVSASVLAALLRFQTQSQWSVAQSAMIIAGLAVLAVAWWASLEDVAQLDGGLSLALLMLLIGAAVSLTTMLSDVMTFGRLGGALTAAVGGATIVWFWRRRASLARGGVTVFVLLMLCLLVGAFYLSGLKPLYAALLAAAPLLAWSGRLLPRRVAPWKRTALRLIIVAIPIAITLALAARDFQRASANQDVTDPYSSSY